MPRNGSGGYAQPVSNFVSGTTIVAADMNSWLNDLGTETANSLAKDGQTVPTANLPMGNFRHTGVSNAASRNQYMTLAQGMDGGADWRGTAGGTANAITFATSPVTTAYVTGETHIFKTGGSANTTAVTVNVNSIGAKSVVTPTGAALVSGQLPANSVVAIRYDGTNFYLLAPPLTAVGQALAASTSATGGRQALAIAPAARTGNVTLTAADMATPQTFNISAVATLTLPALSGVTAGLSAKIRNLETSTAWVVLDGDGTETINGQTTYLIFPGESVDLMATASGWLAFGTPDFGWRRVLKTTASVVAQVDFVLPAGFSSYRVEIMGLRPATDGANAAIRTSTDGGSSFDAGAADYTNVLIGAAAANATSGALSSAIDTSGANESTLIAVDFYPGNGTLRPLANIVNTYHSNTGPATDVQVRGVRRNSATVVNALRFLMSTGNISEGQFSLFARL